MTDAWKRPWPPRAPKTIVVPPLEAQDDIEPITLPGGLTDMVAKNDRRYATVIRHMTKERRW